MPRLSQEQADEILSMPLNEILEQNGYFYKREKNSRNYLTMSNENGDTIVISRQNDGHYLYFNPNEDTDRGNIFSFCKNRGISYKNLIDNPNKVDLSLVQHKLERNTYKNENQKYVDAFKELKELNVERNYLIEKRYIDKALLQNLSNIREDKYKNICIGTFSMQDLKLINATQTKLPIQCGYICYLKAPMKKDKDGRVLMKPIKQICYGSKGLEVIRHKESNIKDIKNIILAESSIDALSAFELKDFKADDTILCATNGQLTQKHKEVLQCFEERLKNATLYLAFDNDKQGQYFSEQMKECLKTMPIQTLTPVLKDFNDDLMIMKHFGLKKDFKPKNIEKALEPLNESIRDFLGKKDILLPLPKIQGFKEAAKTQNKLLYLKTKLEGYIDFFRINRTIQMLDKAIDEEFNKVKGKAV